jgi:hypothetical protein
VKKPVHSSASSTPFAVRQLGRIALGGDLDALAVDDQVVAVGAHLAREGRGRCRA